MAKGLRGRLIACLLALLALFPWPAMGDEIRVPTRLEALRLDGKHFSLAHLPGPVTMLALWSPDSLASRKSIGELQRFATSFQARGVATIAISTSRDVEALRRFADARQLDLPMAILEATDLGPLPEHVLPVIYVFDRYGNCRSVHRGLFRLRDLEGMVAGLGLD